MEDYFTKLVQRVAPKHDAQARAEVVVTRRFLENFSGDQVCGLAVASHCHRNTALLSMRGHETLAWVADVTACHNMLLGYHSISHHATLKIHSNMRLVRASCIRASEQ